MFACVTNLSLALLRWQGDVANTRSDALHLGSNDDCG